MELLLVCGSGYERGTIQDSIENTNDEYPLSRTEQLLICVALVLTRDLIYKHLVEKKKIQKMYLP